MNLKLKKKEKKELDTHFSLVQAKYRLTLNQSMALNG